MMIILNLNENQEFILAAALSEYGSGCWEHSMRREFEQCEEHPDNSCAEDTRKDLADVEVILGQLPGAALSFFRSQLSEHGVGDDGEKADDG